MTRSFAWVFLALFFLAAHWPPSAGRAATAAATLSPDQVATVTRIELYLNQLRTMRARFVQISSNGSYAEGEVIVSRPGSLRFDYDPPHTALLIASGLTLLYYDKELKQASFLPLWETPLWWLVREEVDLTDGLQVMAVEEGLGTLSVTLRDGENPETGEVKLVFSDAPLTLRRWEIVDPQGILTQISLVDPRFGIEIDEAVFDYKDLEINRGQRDDLR